MFVDTSFKFKNSILDFKHELELEIVSEVVLVAAAETETTAWGTKILYNSHEFPCD